MMGMQNSSSIRKHLSPQQREEILQDHPASGLTDKEFARQAGVAVSTLYAWRRKAATVRGGMKVVETWRFENPFSSG
jgi:transposase-like protein